MKNKTDFKWVFIVTILAFIISIIMTLFSTFALDAQFRVDAEDERSGRCIMAYTYLSHFSWRPNFVIYIMN